MIKVNTKLSGDLTADLEKFEKKVKESVLFSGVAAMAKSQYDQIKEGVKPFPISEHDHYFYGTSFKKTGQRYFFKSGNLKAAIYRVYAAERSSEDSKTYRISWNDKKAPYGFMVEYGTSSAPAHPFIRPAFAYIQAAIDAGKARMAQRLADGVVEAPLP
jgi:HK97 gp10 family phage protein